MPLNHSNAIVRALAQRLLGSVIYTFLGRLLLLVTSKPTILIVDDDTGILHVFSKIFENKGFLVTVAQKGIEAIERLKTHKYDVALIDLGLADMEGEKLLPIINKSSPKTLKILLTGKIEREGDIEGADAFVKKPVNPEKLLAIINSKLKVSRHRHVKCTKQA